MAETFFITRPNHEKRVAYLAAWSKELIDLADNKGLKVIDCFGKRANKKEVIGLLTKNKPKLVMLNGHGNEKEIAGQNDEILILANDNEGILKNKIVYARACCSAKILGGLAVNTGCDAYIGYVEDFIFYNDDNFCSRPLDDEVVALFLDPSNEIMRSLLKGHTAKEAFTKSQSAHKNIILKLITNETRDDFKKLLPFIFSNKICQTLLGNPEARIVN
jgi:hypothetical protein